MHVYLRKLVDHSLNVLYEIARSFYLSSLSISIRPLVLYCDGAL